MQWEPQSTRTRCCNNFGCNSSLDRRTRELPTKSDAPLDRYSMIRVKPSLAWRLKATRRIHPERILCIKYSASYRVYSHITMYTHTYLYVEQRASVRVCRACTAHVREEHNPAGTERSGFLVFMIGFVVTLALGDIPLLYTWVTLYSPCQSNHGHAQRPMRPESHGPGPVAHNSAPAKGLWTI